ncbi:hypothetical protein BV20DRAFT_45673 [Pilatotrama ljubarskyi]|nr:hypothetical protein BV20DRAFT_45673 [Pilatotrama ljubarskyi]
MTGPLRCTEEQARVWKLVRNAHPSRFVSAHPSGELPCSSLPCAPSVPSKLEASWSWTPTRFFRQTFCSSRDDLLRRLLECTSLLRPCPPPRVLLYIACNVLHTTIFPCCRRPFKLLLRLSPHPRTETGRYPIISTYMSARCTTNGTTPAAFSNGMRFYTLPRTLLANARLTLARVFAVALCVMGSADADS